MTLAGRTLRIFPKIVALLALLIAGWAVAAVQAPAPARAPAIPGDHEIIFKIPQFVATAVKFKALDETGWDRAGSDEVYVIFSEYDPVRERMSSVYGDVDTGETRNFPASDNCIAPLKTCDHGKSSIHVGVAFWERDDWSWPFVDFCHGALDGTHDLYDNGFCPNDDLIGRADIKLPQADLIAALPNVGDSFERTVKATGGSGSYQLTYRVARLPDVQKSIIIHIPPIDPTLAITLKAMALNGPLGPFIRLDWTGATTATVDLYRDGPLLVNTANDGSERDNPASGVHQYKLCNAGTTTCSATVTVTMP